MPNKRIPDPLATSASPVRRSTSPAARSAPGLAIRDRNIMPMISRATALKASAEVPGPLPADMPHDSGRRALFDEATGATVTVY